MIAKLKNFMTGAFTIHQIFTTSGGNSQEANNSSSAERIGPNRVIFTARMNSANHAAAIGHIGFGVSYRGFAMGKSDEETVIVPVDPCDNDNQPSVERRVLEKRATLTVKTETKFLTVNFTCKDTKVIKSERIKIK